ncbi:MAG: NAD(P)-binding domain-containing protein [Ignavibacteria bacterium]|nr:NAD(P)-binding domain-containing protein [Ignavibacteria bacterium]
MNITIIGAGNVGRALGENLSNSGYKVIFGVKEISEDLKKFISDKKNISLKEVKDSVLNSDIIIFSIPPEVLFDVLKETGELENKILIDATNSISKKPGEFNTVFEALKKKSGSEKVIKCFNSTGFENMRNPRYGDIGIDMFIAGSDEESKKTVIKIVKDMGFEECYDFGGDDKVELLEKFALSWINLAIFQKMGRNIAFKILKR